MKLCVFLSVCCVIAAEGCSTTAPVSLQWESTGGPYAQNVSAILVDNQNAGHLLAGLTNGDVFSTPDNGVTWMKVSTVNPGGAIYGFLQGPENWQRIYAATESGAFVSSTRGKTWERLTIEPGTSSSTSVRALAIDPWKPEIIYAGLRGKGIYKSTDGGDTWSQMNKGVDARLGLSEPYDIAVDVSRPDDVYAAVPGLGLLRSTDAGMSWAHLSEEYTANATNVTQFILKGGTSQTMVFGTSTGNIFKSTDGGHSWSPTHNGLAVDAILSLTALPTKPEVLFAGTFNGVLVSHDFGTSWLPVPGDLPKLTTTLAAADKGTNSALYAFGRGIGVKSSTDEGSTWHRADAQLGGSTVSALFYSENPPRLYAAVHNTLLYYNTDAASWVPAAAGIFGGEITSMTFDPDSPAILFVTTTRGAFKSTDDGATWQSATHNIRLDPDFLDVHPWFKTRMFASGNQGLFISTDKGNTWSQTRPSGSRFRVRSMTFRPDDAGIVYGASQNSGVVLSTNGGISWEAIKYGLDPGDIAAVTLDDKDPSTAYAWTEQGVGYRTTNRGTEWNRYAPPWTQGDTIRFSFDRHTPSSVVALVNGRNLYFSRSGGGTWVPIPVHDMQAEVVSVLWNARTSTFFAGTKDGVVFRISIGKILRKTYGD